MRLSFLIINEMGIMIYKPSFSYSLTARHSLIPANKAPIR